MDHLDHKTPTVRCEATGFLTRCFAKSTTATLPKKLLKLLAIPLMKVKMKHTELFIHLFIHLFIYLFIHLFIHLSIYLFICLFIYLFYLIRVIASTVRLYRYDCCLYCVKLPTQSVSCPCFTTILLIINYGVNSQVS